MSFITGVADAVEKAAIAAENPDLSGSRTLDLVQQVRRRCPAVF